MDGCELLETVLLLILHHHCSSKSSTFQQGFFNSWPTLLLGFNIHSWKHIPPIWTIIRIKMVSEKSTCFIVDVKNCLYSGSSSSVIGYHITSDWTVSTHNTRVSMQKKHIERTWEEEPYACQLPSIHAALEFRVQVSENTQEHGSLSLTPRHLCLRRLPSVCAYLFVTSGVQLAFFSDGCLGIY